MVGNSTFGFRIGGCLQPKNQLVKKRSAIVCLAFEFGRPLCQKWLMRLFPNFHFLLRMDVLWIPGEWFSCLCISESHLNANFRVELNVVANIYFLSLLLWIRWHCSRKNAEVFSVSTVACSMTKISDLLKYVLVEFFGWWKDD